MSTEKQKQFCAEYVKDYNATQAAIRAGYKEKNASAVASRLLKDPDIINEIKENQKRLIESSCLTEEKIVANLEEILARSMQTTPVMQWDYNTHEMKETGEYQFDSKSALEAIKLLGKHLGMFEKKDNITLNDDYAKQFINALNNKAKEFDKKDYENK